MWQVSTDRHWRDATICRTYKQRNIMTYSEVSLHRQSRPWTAFVPINSNINHMLRHSDSKQTYCMLKPTRCTNFSNLFLEWNSICFGQFLCPSSGVFHCTHNGICHTGYADSLWTEAYAPARKPTTSWVHYTTSCNTQSGAPEDGQNNCPKHAKLTGMINKPLLFHLVGCLYYLPFIIYFFEAR